MKKKSNVEIFISHSHKDKLFIEFVNTVLKDCLFSNFRKEEIRFTSNSEYTILTGESNLQLFDDISTTRIFISCISKHYKASEFCLLEMGAAYLKYKTQKKNSIVIFPILAEGLNYKETLPNLPDLQHAYISDIEGLKALYTKISNTGITLTNEKDYFKKLQLFKNKYSGLKRKYYQNETRKKSLYQFITNSFATDSDIDFPITFFCNRNDYESISIQTAKIASHSLFWTLYKSPLTVEDAFSNKDFLTQYDKEFRDASSTEKTRLVIFEDYTMAEEYLNLDIRSIRKSLNIKIQINKKDIEVRKYKFEKANAGFLYYTTKEQLKNWYKRQFSKIIPLDFDYEFGFISKDDKNQKSNFGFTSGFTSYTFDDDNAQKHFIVYPESLDTSLELDFRKTATASPDYYMFFDIPIQLEIVKAMKNMNSLLRKKYVIQGGLNSKNILRLK